MLLRQQKNLIMLVTYFIGAQEKMFRDIQQLKNEFEEIKDNTSLMLSGK